MADPNSDTIGGVPVASAGAAGGVLVDQPGQIQYGRVLFGAGSAAGWRELVNWRSLPEGQANDAPRPQAHGSYPGDVWADALLVTFTYLVRGKPDAKARAINALEAHTPMDGVDRMLVVDDGLGPSFRMARVIGRQVPQGWHYLTGPVECSVQWQCADPRRYDLAERTTEVSIPSSVGGLDYPLAYPLDYGTTTGGASTATNDGGTDTPVTATFHGPLVNPVLRTDQWAQRFDITLTEGETLTTDSAAGTAVLNGGADRLYTIRNDSDPLGRCYLPPGTSTVSLAAASGSGRAVLSYRNAYM